jgi:predicted dehydrogenase
MNRQYTVAVLGAGKRGKLHAQSHHENENFKVVGLCDIDKERLEAAAPVCGNPELYTDAAKMLAEQKPDIFVFATPPAIRLPLIRLGAEHNVKLISYEKPMSTNFNEALDIMKVCREANVKTVLSHQQKYGAHHQAVKKIVESGELGRIETVYAHCWGWYLHMVTHLIDYIRMYNNNTDALWVSGTVSGREKLSDNHPSPDYAGGFIQFANGVRGILETGAKSPDVPEIAYDWHKGRFLIQGTEGFAEVFIGEGWRAVTKNGGAQSGGGKFDYVHDQACYVQEIADWLDGKCVHSCNGEDAFKGFEIAMALLRSAAERKIIDLPMSYGENEIELLKKVMPE